MQRQSLSLLLMKTLSGVMIFILGISLSVNLYRDYLWDKDMMQRYGTTLISIQGALIEGELEKKDRSELTQVLTLLNSEKAYKGSKILKSDGTVLLATPGYDTLSNVTHFKRVLQDKRGTSQGTLELAISNEYVEELTVDDFIYWGGAFLILISVTLGALYWSLHRNVLGPIQKITQTMEKMETDLSLRMSPSTSTELTEMGQSFNHLTDALEAAQRKLQLQNMALELAKDESEAANVAKSQFLANMSHELRTPLNAIIGYSDMILEDLEEGVTLDPQQLKEDVQKITGSGQHLLELISDILDLSKIEAGKITVEATEFDVDTVIAGVREIIEPLCSKNKNTFRVKGEGGCGSMVSDPTKIKQNLINLLSNANKFTEQGDVVLTYNIVNVESQEMVLFMVQDSGIGMSKDQLEKIFDPFTQADASTTRKYGGTGLGLAITKRFCEMLGGSLDVTSTPGVGSTFTMMLPKALTVSDNQKTGTA